MLTIIIPGEPVAKGRGRVGINPGTGRAQVFTPAKTRQAEGEIKFFAQQAMRGQGLMTGPLEVSVIAYRSKGMPGKADAKPGTKGAQQWADAQAGRIVPQTKPDLDNTIKVLDALNGVVWLDDAAIVRIVAEKRYSDRPRLEIRISPFVP